MATVVYLADYESPPGGIKWALVKREERASKPRVGPVSHDRGVTFLIPIVAAEHQIEAALAQACEWADRNGVANVYVKGISNAQGS